MSNSEPSAIVDRAHAYADAGRGEDALRQFREGLAAHPESAMLWRGLASQLYSQGEYVEGLAAADRALSISPDSRGGQYLRCSLLLGAGRAVDALDASAELIQRHPDHGPSLMLHALALSKGPQSDEAATKIRDLIARALAMDPTDIGTLRLAAQLSDIIRDNDKAIEYVNAGLALAPDDADLLLARSSLTNVTLAERARLLAGLLGRGTRDPDPHRRFHALLWSNLARLAQIPLTVSATLAVAYFAVRLSPTGVVGYSIMMTAIYGLLVLPQVAEVRKTMPPRYFRSTLARDPRTLIPVIALAVVSALAFVLPISVEYLGFDHYRAGFALLLVAGFLCFAAESLARWAEFASAQRSDLYPAKPASHQAALHAYRHSVHTLAAWGAFSAGLGAVAVLALVTSDDAARQPDAVWAVAALASIHVAPTLLRISFARLQLRRANRDGESIVPLALWITAFATIVAVAIAAATVFVVLTLR